MHFSSQQNLKHQLCQGLVGQIAEVAGLDLGLTPKALNRVLQIACVNSFMMELKNLMLLEKSKSAVVTVYPPIQNALAFVRLVRRTRINL